MYVDVPKGIVSGKLRLFHYSREYNVPAYFQPQIDCQRLECLPLRASPDHQPGNAWDRTCRDSDRPQEQVDALPRVQVVHGYSHFAPNQIKLCPQGAYLVSAGWYEINTMLYHMCAPLICLHDATGPEWAV